MKQTSEPLQCVYSITRPEILARAMGNLGRGELVEGTPWASAFKHWAAKGRDEPYPLLLGNAASGSGVEWAALIESIELLDQGKSRVRFHSLVCLPESIPLHDLQKSSNNELLSDSYRRPYVPCKIRDELARMVLHVMQDTAWVREPLEEDPFADKTIADFVAALSAVENQLPIRERSMLIEHAQAPEHTLSALRLAQVGGYDLLRTSEPGYIWAGRLFANFFGMLGFINSNQAVANVFVQNHEGLGHGAWTMRPALAEALRQIGWVKRDASYYRSAAELELAADPEVAELPATTRQALVDARIGQGSYRQRMLQIWGGRCALTGCSTAQVLIASHAKPWARSNSDERLDPYNGLLLAAHVDRLFDSGLISFSDDGQMLVSPQLPHGELARLGLSSQARLRLVHERHKPYFRAHRALYGFKP